MNEAELTHGLINYSDLIEPGLTFKAREVNLDGKRCDLLFVDKDGKDLYVEVKKHVDVNGGGQLMLYHGLVSNGSARFMLVAFSIMDKFIHGVHKVGFEYVEMKEEDIYYRFFSSKIKEGA
ncbi:hypothetical protein CR203_21620 [Salipaludibacillus neizhouensis]|uniref:Endonuclease NucS C-terminal domain-containing protein n=1 Tax=Salipaludibacillus neizhouensis TaxID=885475 RepID=A0A3A9K6K8_9BACI|nr:endonuclease NucS domain-containing protein [Salipaludibacillus neizhouensis]RKL65273.1 hypothetical protein CR203_21620 [Salipaludibacillus neizhouensis]